MKLFSVIFAIIVFSQSVFVDCEMPLFPQPELEAHSCCAHQEQSNDDTREKNSHSCSPFCSMDCCSTAVYISYSQFVENVPSEEETAYFSHLNNYSYSFGVDLYHPPRI